MAFAPIMEAIELLNKDNLSWNKERWPLLARPVSNSFCTSDEIDSITHLGKGPAPAVLKYSPFSASGICSCIVCLIFYSSFLHLFIKWPYKEK